MNNNPSCAHRPHQTSASREPSSLHRFCGPPDRCALSTHGDGDGDGRCDTSRAIQCWPAAVAANVRASARSTAGCKARAHCIASYRSSRCTCTLCTVCLCLALEPFTGLHAVIVVLPLPLLRPLFGTFCLRKGAVSKLRRSVCDGEARCEIQRQGRHDIFYVWHKVWKEGSNVRSA